jgi:Family of unknown function (DUF5372)
MPGILVQDLPQVRLAGDQQVVQELPAQCSDEALGEGIGPHRQLRPVRMTGTDVRVTHRFHPLFGQDFEFVAHRQNWGEDRVHLHDEDGVLLSLPAGSGNRRRAWRQAGRDARHPRAVR